ncbi:saposin B domain-containing protein [Zea mays]|uniref:Saposin B domain-containing protein n=1 Tax=Zea mays TaxID=4577 RepID=A0A1D6FQR7_MAIZE|nr:saposin B domain-containing protein [Zea mays]
MDTGAQAMFIISLVLWCTTSFALDDAAATRIPIVGTLPLSMKENPQLCQLCEEFASEALFYLNENETQTEIIDTLHQACSKFGSFKLECTRLVDYYVPLFFTKIASLSPEEFCASASFCGGVTFIRLPRHEDTCTLCHEVVDEVVTNLEDPGMEVFACYTIIISFYATQFLYGLCLFFMLCSLIVMIQVTFSLNFW